MANARGKAIDNTHLSADTAEERVIIHRDLIAHVFRWTHVAKRLHEGNMFKTARVLDIGCGVDLPLARMLYSNRLVVDNYIGIEYNKQEKLKSQMFEKGKFPLNVYGGVDFASNAVSLAQDEKGFFLNVKGDEHDLPNVFVSFEVLEHVEPAHTRAIMKKIRMLMQHASGDPICYISTPCYDAQVGAAANHVNEITREALGAMLEDIGLAVVKTYGTFASIRDYRDRLLTKRPELKQLYAELHEYYDSNVLATIFAPIVPEYARNNLWELKLPGPGYVRQFKPLTEVKGPWTSSDLWQELNKDL